MPVFLCPACGKTLHSEDRWPPEHALCPACGMISEPPLDTGYVPPAGAAWSAASPWSASSKPIATGGSPASAREPTTHSNPQSASAAPWLVRMKWMSIGAAAVGLPLLMLFAFVFSQNRIQPQSSVASGVARPVTSQPTTAESSAPIAPINISSAQTRTSAPADVTVIASANPQAAASKPIVDKAETSSPSRAVPSPSPSEPTVVARPALRPTPIPREGGISDEEVERSIRHGIDYLSAQFDPKHRALRGAVQDGTARGCGADALAVYALLHAGLSANDERFGPRGEIGRAMLDGVKSLPNSGGPETYATALRAACLALFNRKEDQAALAEDVESLLHAQVDGAYSYGTAHRVGTGAWKMQNAGKWDNSNSQYGVLGVWAAADAGAPVPAEYWDAIETHWNGSQCENGQWSYGGPAGLGTLSMTAAGLATLVTLHDFNDAGLLEAPIGRPPFRPAVQDALGWWESGDHAIDIPETENWGYTLYGIERVGLATGQKYFGKNDWYRLLARRAIGRQLPDGSWDKNPIESSYVLLFLSRGRHPLLMNKLRFDGYWANRPRDAANLTRFISRETERPVNWQVADIRRPWQEWLDAPILSIASHKAPKFTEEEIDKLRNYALAGGMIVTQSDGRSKEFESFVPEFAKRLFPKYDLADLPDDHPFNTAAGTVKGKMPPAVRLRAIQSRTRILLLHSPADLAEAWQLRKGDPSDPSFRFGMNLLFYAGGRHDLRNRIDAISVLEPPAKAPLGRIKIARLQYAGDWDPEPFAWTRFSRLFQFRTGTALDIASVDLKALRDSEAAVAHLTGSAEYRPTDEEQDALKAYVERGGVVFIDDSGGAGNFARPLRQSLLKTFGPAALGPLSDQHPLLRAGAPGMTDLTKPVLRSFAMERSAKPEFPGIISFGKGHIIFIPLDVSSGFLGTGTWGINGYEPRYAQSLVQNVIFWAMDAQPDRSNPAAPSTDKVGSRVE